MSSPLEIVRANGCDSPDPPSVYLDYETNSYSYRCIVCKHHTGNSNQGHYWAWCSVTDQAQDFHFCCPDNCELQVTE